MTEVAPEIQQILDQMRASMGEAPPAIEKVAGADAAMVLEQARSSTFAMPRDEGALEPETRTLSYLAVAPATSNEERTIAMVNKARIQTIDTANLLEAFHFARFDRATQVLENAEPLFGLLDKRCGVTTASEGV